MRFHWIRRSVVTLMLTSSIVGISSQPAETSPPSRISVQLTPGVEFPIQREVRPLFRIAYGFDLVARMPLRRGLTPAAGLAYTLVPLRADTSISALGVGIGGGITADLGRFQVSATALGGGYYSFFNEPQTDSEGIAYENQSGAAGFASGAGELSFFLSPSVSLGVGALYHNYLGLFQSARAHISTTLHLAGLRRQVLLRSIELDPVFPALLLHYGDHALGSATVTNNERFAITDVRVDLLVRDHMRTSRSTPVAAQMLPGETRRVGLYALFGEGVLDLTEGARVPAEVTLRYTLNGREREVRVVEPMRLHHRNGMTWDDDRKAAAFVTAKDAQIIRFASRVAALVRREGPAAVNPNLRLAMGMFNAISEYGMSYVIDPNTPAYIDASANVQIVDFLQFPRETFMFRGGDCDDLSILYCALLESVGVATAFVTVPGHIFVAVSLGITTGEARRLFPDDRLFFELDGTAWIPVETTLVGESFHRAWQAGWSQWEQEAATGRVEAYPMIASWQLYPAAGWAGDDIVVELPDEARLHSRYIDEMGELVRRQLLPQVEQLQASILQSRDPVRLQNRLGVLYAQYGLVDDATSVFEEILRRREYLPALINLGNIHYLNGRDREALDLFERAQSVDPDSAIAVLNLARISQDLGEHAKVRVHYAKLQELSPELSAEFSYLAPVDESTSRASDAQLGRTRMLWEEE